MNPTTPFNQSAAQVSPHQTKVPIIMGQALRSENICCLTARSWSNLIAWMQIVGSVLGVVVAIVLLATLGSQWDWINSPEFRNSIPKSLDTKGTGTPGKDLEELLQKLTNTIYNGQVAFAVLLLITSTLGLIMGGLLHHGVSREKPRYLLVWIILTGFCIILGVASAISISVIAQSFKTNITIFLVNIFINIFFVWVVGKHRSEMVEFDKRMTNPIQHNSSKA